MPALSIVTTLYCSERFVHAFYDRVKHAAAQVTDFFEVIFVNDGSPDGSREKVLELVESDGRVVLVDLARNFGHHQAIMVGLAHAKGDYVFLIDSDLEEEPETLHAFWEKISHNPEIDVVYGIQIARKGGLFERLSGSAFYHLLNSLTKVPYPRNTTTARLMRRAYVEAVLTFKEKSLDIWTIFVMVGFVQKGISLTKKSKGSSTYTFGKKVKMAIDIITSVSHRPLYLIFLLGTVWLGISTINIMLILINKWIYREQVAGWTSIMASIWLIGGVIIFLLGVIGIYLSRVFVETKNRPIAVVRKVYKKEIP